jgi:hypothetical protein
MNKAVRFASLAMCACVCSFLYAQTPNQPTTANQAPAVSAPAPATPQTQAPSAPRGFTLEDATPVRMRINRTVSSSDAHVGDTIDFEVLEEVRVNNVLVVPKGGLAFATVTEAQAKRRMARGGKLDINIDYVRLVDDEKAALRAVKAVQGGGHTGAMTGGIVATSLVFWPAAPFFLFMHGKDITIPKGTEITAYVNGDMKLDLAKFDVARAPSPANGELAGSAATAAQPTGQGTASAVPNPQAPGGTAAPAPAAASTAQLQIESTPDGADIEIDGSFVGDTPSTVGLSSGQHDISVKKPGFKPWERKITVSSGQVNVNAMLEAEQK